MSTSGNRVQRAGLRITRHPTPVTLVDHAGLPLASPAETLLACARDLNMLDVVVLADAALHLDYCTFEEIRSVLDSQRRGSPVPMLRVLHVACGVPVEPQRVLLDQHGGFVARGDLHLLGTHTLHEYDGGTHRDRSVRPRGRRPPIWGGSQAPGDGDPPQNPEPRTQNPEPRTPDVAGGPAETSVIALPRI